MSTDSLQERSVVELLDASFHLLRDQFGSAFRLYVVPVVVVDLAILGQIEGIGAVPAFLAVFLIYVLVLSVAGYALTHRLARQFTSRSSPVGSAREALAYSPRIVATSLLVVLAVVFGLLALVVPGVWLLLAFFVVGPVMVLERSFGRRALRRSWTLMRGHKRRVLVPGLLWIVLDVALDSGALALVGADSVLQDVIYAIPSALLETFMVVFALLLYLDIRFRKEGFDLEVLAGRVAQEGAAAQADVAPTRRP